MAARQIRNESPPSTIGYSDQSSVASYLRESFRDLEKEMDKIEKELRDLKIKSSPKTEPKTSLSKSNPLDSPEFSLFRFNNLPSVEVPVFAGDPKDFHSFLLAFETLIEAKTVNEQQCLFYLMQYTKGEVHNLVRSCMTMGDERPYSKAKALIKEHYGHDYVVSTAMTEDILAFPPLKPEDGRGLKKFSLQLVACYNGLKSMGCLANLENAQTMKNIIGKLPYGLRQKWRYKATKICDTRNVALKDIVDFVSKEAKAATHPIFGMSVNVTNSGIKAKGLSTVASEKSDTYKEKFCGFCKGSHWLQECQEFEKSPLETKVELLKKRGLCFNCFRPRHSAKECRMPPSCRECKGKHHTWIHRNSTDSVSVSVTNGQKPSEKVATNACGNSSQISFSLPIVPVQVRTPGGKGDEFKTYALLDTGSNITFCSKKIADSIQARTEEVKLSLSTLEKKNSVSNAQKTSLEICGIDGETYLLDSVFVRNELPATLDDMFGKRDLKAWPHLWHLGNQIVDNHAEPEVGIIIGSDNWQLLEPKEIIPSLNESPYAVKTALGWTINGPMGHSKARSVRSCFVRLEEEWNDYCNREFEENKYFEKVEMSIEESKALKIMQESCKLKNGHLQVSLPFKYSKVKLPNNEKVTRERLVSLSRKLRKDPETHRKYCKAIDDLLQQGFAEKCGNSDTDNDLVWYLPHHAVTHPMKPEKLRVVFDCSNKFQGVSLNDILLQGPDLNNSLIGTLIRFRQYPVAISADIEGMFNQVHVEPQQRDLLRFLWYSNGDLDSSVETFRMKTHIFGAVSSPSVCNFALKRCAEFDDVSTEVASAIRSSFYVDDCLHSCNDEASAISMVHGLRDALAKGGFNLTKWASNRETVLKTIPIETKTVKGSQTIDSQPQERVLGIGWNTEMDTLEIKYKSPDPTPPTRRTILGAMSSSFDPMGFAAPFLLQSKILLQDLCKLGWDEQIPPDKVKVWERWRNDLQNLENLKIDRWIGMNNTDDTSVQLHLFSDASEKGYGSVAYLRVKRSEDVHCYFLLGKSRVAPLKAVTIPRLELSAALLSVKLSNLIQVELPVSFQKILFWTDSTAVLKYVRNETKRFHTFVANRVSKIRLASDPSQWRYVSSAENPADVASRGCSADQLNQRWICGPTFLLEGEDQWPVCPEIGICSGEDPEVKRETVSHCAATSSTNSQPPLHDLFNKVSSWNKLKRIVAWLCRYKQNLRAKSRGEATELGLLSVKELEEAECLIVKEVQKESFKGETVPVKRSSPLRKLDPIMVNGILRVGGRLAKAAVEEDTKHPIILPKNHPVTKLVIMYYHVKCGHQGRNHTLAEVRSKYWIIRGNATVRGCLKTCNICRRVQGPMCNQKMASLPKDRVEPFGPAFTSVGVDLFGPFMVKRGRSLVKQYGCIFTCLTIRAVHLEVVHSMDTDSMINALRRFIARRGKPKKMYSDNGTNLVGAEKELREMLRTWNQEKINNALTQEGVEWHFNPPGASHQGGIWERCIRTVRKIMNAILREQTLTDESLQTLFCEIEAIMNGRPLTNLTDDPSDLTPLTPKHLLLLRDDINYPPGLFDPKDKYCRRRWKQVQYLCDQFWQRWLKEYVPTLQERQKWHVVCQNLKKGDLVLVSDERVVRGQWPLGIVEDTYQDQDGLVRRVLVRTANGLFKRDVRKLCLLECAHTDNV